MYSIRFILILNISPQKTFIYNLLIKQEYPELSIGIVTVYRTLRLLEENDIVSSISLGVQGKKYEIANKPHHDHIICEVCNVIVEFENKEIEELQHTIATENGFKLTTHLMQLYGICEACQNIMYPKVKTSKSEFLIMPFYDTDSNNLLFSNT